MCFYLPQHYAPSRRERMRIIELVVLEEKATVSVALFQTTLRTRVKVKAR